MPQNKKRDIFGNAKPINKRIVLQSSDAKQNALLCLQPSDNINDDLWMSQLKRATDWKFYTNQFHLNDFRIFFAKRPRKKMVIMIRNQSEDGQKNLLSYEHNACYNIKNPNKKVLPNQLSLFNEEPKDLLSLEDETYENYNPYDIDSWNKTINYLEQHSKPITTFRWLLPVNYENCEYLQPFLIHLNRIQGLHYRIISHEMISMDLLYEVKYAKEALYDQIYP